MRSLLSFISIHLHVLTSSKYLDFSCLFTEAQVSKHNSDAVEMFMHAYDYPFIHPSMQKSVKSY